MTGNSKVDNFALSSLQASNPFYFNAFLHSVVNAEEVIESSIFTYVCVSWGKKC